MAFGHWTILPDSDRFKGQSTGSNAMTQAPEMDMAKAELEHLRQRFRQRVEHEQSGLPLGRSQDLLLAQNSVTKKLFPLQTNPNGVIPPPWLHSYAVAMSAKPPIATPSPSQVMPTVASAPWTIPSSISGSQQGQWLLPTTMPHSS